MEKLKKYVPQLCYVAATVSFIASIVANMSGKSDGATLGIGGLFLILGFFYSERAKKNKDK